MSSRDYVQGLDWEQKLVLDIYTNHLSSLMQAPAESSTSGNPQIWPGTAYSATPVNSSRSPENINVARYRGVTTRYKVLVGSVRVSEGVNAASWMMRVSLVRP